MKVATKQTMSYLSLINIINGLYPQITFTTNTFNTLRAKNILGSASVDIQGNKISINKSVVNPEIKKVNDLLRNSKTKEGKNKRNAKIWKWVGFFIVACVAFTTASEFQVLKDLEFVGGLFGLFTLLYVLLEKLKIKPINNEEHYNLRVTKYREFKSKVAIFKIKKIPSFDYRKKIVELQSEYNNI